MSLSEVGTGVDSGLSILKTLAPSLTTQRHEDAMGASPDAMRRRGPGGHHVEVALRSCCCCC